MNIEKSFDALLQIKGVTSLTVAKELKVTAQTISLWKNGKVFPRKQALEAISKYAGVPVSVFISWGECEY